MSGGALTVTYEAVLPAAGRAATYFCRRVSCPILMPSSFMRSHGRVVRSAGTSTPPRTRVSASCGTMAASIPAALRSVCQLAAAPAEAGLDAAGGLAAFGLSSGAASVVDGVRATALIDEATTLGLSRCEPRRPMADPELDMVAPSSSLPARLPCIPTSVFELRLTCSGVAVGVEDTTRSEDRRAFAGSDRGLAPLIETSMPYSSATLLAVASGWGVRITVRGYSARCIVS